METFLGIMIPFLGTTLGAACVLSLIHIFSESVTASRPFFTA